MSGRESLDAATSVTATPVARTTRSTHGESYQRRYNGQLEQEASSNLSTLLTPLHHGLQGLSNESLEDSIILPASASVSPSSAMPASQLSSQDSYARHRGNSILSKSHAPRVVFLPSSVSCNALDSAVPFPQSFSTDAVKANEESLAPASTDAENADDQVGGDIDFGLILGSLGQEISF